MTEIGCMARLHDISESADVHPLIAEAAGKEFLPLIEEMQLLAEICALILDASGITKQKNGEARLVSQSRITWNK